jgi:hypothetical protein
VALSVPAHGVTLPLLSMLYRMLDLPAVLLVAGICTGCVDDGDDDGRSDRLLTGFADGDIAMAGVRMGDILKLYVCGGEQTYATHTMWFHAVQIEGDVIDGQAMGASVHGEIDERGDMSGTLRDVDGVDHPWELTRVDDGSLAGLYTATTEGCTTGVIVWESGTDQSSGGPAYDGQGTWCNMASEFEQVIILTPIALTSMGLEVSVPTRPGFESFYVEAF